MGNKYHQEVDCNIAKHGAQGPAQSEGLATEPEDLNNNRGDREGVC